MHVNKLQFLDQYGIPGRHYDREKEVKNIIRNGSVPEKDATPQTLRNDLFFAQDEGLGGGHVDDMRQSNNIGIRGAALKHPSTEEHHLIDILSHPKAKDAHDFMVSHPKANQHVIDHIIEHGESYNVRDAIMHPNNKKVIHHIDTLYSDGRHQLVSSLLDYNNVSPDVIRHIHSKNDPKHTYAIAGHKNTPDDVHESLYKTYKTNPLIVGKILSYTKSPDLINKIMSSANKTTLKSGDLHSALAYNKNAPTEHLVDVANHPKLSNASKRFAEAELLKRGHYDKELGISESLDSVVPKETIPEDSMVHQMGLMSAAMIGGTNFSIHKIGDLGHLVQFDKDGATEVHHLDPMLSGGHLVGSATPSMRMVSTFKNHIQGLLDDGKTVRISTHKNMAKGFRSITQRLIDKNPEYKMSEPTDTTHELTGDELTQWELKK